MNRMNDFIDIFKIKGEILFNDVDIYSKNIDPTILRKSIGMVFQNQILPKSIYDNITWGPKMNGFDGDKDELVEDCLIDSGL